MERSIDDESEMERLYEAAAASVPELSSGDKQTEQSPTAGLSAAKPTDMTSAPAVRFTPYCNTVSRSGSEMAVAVSYDIVSGD